MGSLSPALRQETAFLSSSTKPERTLSPPWASRAPAGSNGLYSFTLQSVGGVVFLADCVPGTQPERGIHWQFENSATGALHLTEFTVHGGASGPRTTVEVAYQLFPALAASGTADGRLLLAGLLSSGYLLHVELRASASTDSILSALTAAALRPLDLTQQLAPLGTPTSLAATPDAVVIGGSNGSVLCVPLACLEDGNASRCYELRDSSWAISKLIPGVLYRPRQPAALACVPVTLGHRPILLVAYDDCVLRAFHAPRKQQLATLELETPGVGASAPGGSSRHLVPTYIAAESGSVSGLGAGAGPGSAGSATLVVQLEASDTLKRHTFAYTLAATAAGRLSLAQPVELAVEEGAVVEEARVSGDTVWLLLKAAGRSKVLGYTRSSGAVVSSAVLSEGAGELLGGGGGGQGGNGAEVDMELWEWLLGAFPRELSAESQVCQQVLVPGHTCRASLRDALSYHGAQQSAADVDSAPYAVLRGWMQAAVLAIQRRTPTASASECWQSFLSTYRSAWARRHPPLGLVLHRGSPEWLGLARGGAVLCVLRRGTAVEALYGADAVAALELPPHMDAVHKCATEAGGLLGPLAQEACLALLTAGVDPLERLVPYLTDLWLGGPTASYGGSATVTVTSRSAALTDAARESQQRWRQRRQQLLISMGQRLGSLANPAAAVQSYLSLLRLLGNQAAAELAAGAPAGPDGSTLGPSKAAAAFLVATCRQLSRAAAAAARDAALLLGLIRAQAGLGAGAGPLDRAQLVRLEGPLLAEACGLLRRSALGLWLTGTPSSQGEGSDMEPALSALRHLRLGGSPSKRSHADGPGASASAAAAAGQQPDGSSSAPHGASGSGSGAVGGDASLAARLLPAFCAGYSGGRGGRMDLLTGAEAAGLLFTLYLQFGEHPSAPMGARVLQLGYQLFQAGEYGGLAELAALAGSTGAAEAGPQFLRGLGITCALALERQQAATRQVLLPSYGPAGAAGSGSGSGSSSARRAERVAEAASCFFRAAASLASESGDALRSILRDLRSELAGTNGTAATSQAAALAAFGGGASSSAAVLAAPPAAGPAAAAARRREAALLQLHFCEAVMQLFEREGAPEGAVVFATAALEHLRSAYGQSEASDPLLPGEEAVQRAAAAAAAAERTAREGRLWSNIYTYCVEMRQYDRAYAALLANPLPAARLQSLRHLVHVLAQADGNLQTLCTLPLAGIAVLPAAADGPAAAAAASTAAAAGGRTVSLLGEALDTLQRRAHNCDLAERPQPYRVLYDFLVCRGDFKGAARAMAAYAWRLRSEGATGEAAVAEALRAYDLAISCLQLLDPEDAWLDLTDPWIERLAPHSTHAAPPPAQPAHRRHPSSAALTAAAAAIATAEGDAREVAAAVAAQEAQSPVATAQTLQRERTLLHYSALVAARVPGLEPLRQWDNVDAILRQLLLLGRYEGALALVADCYGGGPGGGAAGGAGGGGGAADPWVRAMEAVVAALAAHCTRLQLQDGGVATGGPALPPTDLFVDDPDGGAAAAGLGAAGAAAVAGTLGGRAAPLWSKLRQLLAAALAADAAAEAAAQGGGAAAGGGAAGGGGGGVRVAWILRDAAAEAVLRTDSRVDLPQWLLDLFLAPGPDTAAMGSSACGPASLLQLYLAHDRLASAVELVAGQVEAWGRADVRLRRRHSAAWMPYPQLELLHTKLTIAQQLGQERSAALMDCLNAALSAHLDLVATDTERLQQQTGSGGGGGFGGGGSGMGGGFGGGAGGSMDGTMPPPLLLLGPAPSAVATPVTPLMGGPGFGAASMGGGLRLFG
ncbi:hypothetical protein HYH03_008437 [Edaphochlamys debaryana]|uniref:Nuclear pore complex protein Nup160 n=1 Tax=Edaphochlamys debaryana TaxID=47281 RepID=A0A836BXZ7_9CHLO|nr:hypothetical protein HYH03_008437 [Edaphochlamys debaryana]|eukprot:KAG2493301.1 hypothetical protein HYH03_008437 [Edaphochlamys debaryana]